MRTPSPLLLPTIALIAGIIIHEFGASMMTGAILTGAAVTVYLSLLRLSGNIKRGMRLNRWHSLWIGLLFIGIGTIAATLNAPEEMKPGIWRIEGRVETRESTTSGDRLTINIHNATPMDGERREIRNTKMLLTVPPGDIRRADEIIAEGELQRITDSPHRLPSGYEKRMKRSGIPYRMWISDMDTAEVERLRITGKRETLQSRAGEVRDRLEIFIAHTNLSENTRAFLTAMLLGERSQLDDTTRRHFADAGIAHVLALSGMHLGIITLFLLGILFPVNLLGAYKFRYILTLLILWGYAILTGLSPSIVRAAIMATCLMGGIILERKQSSLNALLAAIFIICIVSPSTIFDIGFQLSVACVASLILFATPLNPVDHRSRPRLYSAAGAIISTLVATLSTWVISAWYFHKFPLCFLPVNLIVLPLLPWYAGGAILYLILQWTGIDFEILGKILDFGMEILEAITSWGSKGSISIHISEWTLMLWGFGLVLLAIGIDRSRRYSLGIAASGVIILATAIATIPLLKPIPPEGFILGGTRNRIILTTYQDGGEEERELPRGSLTTLRGCGHKIVLLDGRAEGKRFGKEFKNADILIIGSHFTGSLNDIERYFHPAMIFLHSSLGERRENKLCEEYEGELPVHSMRTQGSIHRFKEGER